MHERAGGEVFGMWSTSGVADGVPPDVLQARPRRGAPGEVRGGRLRHHDRPGRARRPAHRQGLRGRPPARDRRSTTAPATTPSSSTHPRRGASCASSTSTPRLRTSPAWGPIRSQADSITAMLQPPHRSPRGHAARGDAGPGDRRRHRGPEEAALRIGASWSTRSAGRRCRRRPRDRRGRPRARRGRHRRPQVGLDAHQRAMVRGLLTQAPDHADRVAHQGAGGDPHGPRPTYRLPQLADGIEAGGIRELADL